jgi:hypothetical protein
MANFKITSVNSDNELYAKTRGRATLESLKIALEKMVHEESKEHYETLKASSPEPLIFEQVEEIPWNGVILNTGIAKEAKEPVGTFGYHIKKAIELASTPAVECILDKILIEHEASEEAASIEAQIEALKQSLEKVKEKALSAQEKKPRSMNWLNSIPEQAVSGGGGIMHTLEEEETAMPDISASTPPVEEDKEEDLDDEDDDEEEDDEEPEEEIAEAPAGRRKAKV